MYDLSGPDQDKLEDLVDKVGVGGVLDALVRIAYEKADHVDSNWQDRRLAAAWRKVGTKLSKYTAIIRRMEQDR